MDTDQSYGTQGQEAEWESRIREPSDNKIVTFFFPFSPLLSSTHNSLAHFYCLSTDHHSTLCSELMAEDDFLLALEYSYFSTAT